MGAAIEGDRAAHRARGAAWLALPLGTLIALGQGQKPESTSGYAGSGGGFGAIKSAQNLTSRFLVITAPRPESSVIVPVASHGGVARIVGDVVVARIIAVAVAVDVGVPPRRWIPPVAGPF